MVERESHDFINGYDLAVTQSRGQNAPTDYPYSRRLLDSSDWARLIAPPKPFHVLPYGYATSPADTQWLARLDQFVSDIRRDGRLARAARNNGLTEIVAP